MKLEVKLLILTLIFINFGCQNESQEEEQTQSQIYLCCGNNPFASQNVYNLDQSAGAVNVVPVFTPNGDGFNDFLNIENIDLYPNNTVTLYDLNNNQIFTTIGYSSTNLFVGPLNMNNGTLKYKLVIENEQTFVEYGYVCIVTGIGPFDISFSFYNQCSYQEFDPMIAN